MHRPCALKASVKIHQQLSSRKPMKALRSESGQLAMPKTPEVVRYASHFTLYHSVFTLHTCDDKYSEVNQCVYTNHIRITICSELIQLNCTFYSIHTYTQTEVHVTRKKGALQIRVQTKYCFHM